MRLIQTATLCLAIVFGSFTAHAEEVKTVPESQAEVTLSFAPLVRKTHGSVVNVYAEKVVNRPTLFDNDPFFQEFFGQQMPNRTERQSSLGSGVIIDSEGLVITNNHVIANGDDIRVALADGREYACEVVIRDERLDLALLRIKGEGEFQALTIGNSDAVEVGDLVLAVGNPFGVGQTVTSGIISALARQRLAEGDFGVFLQTDAAINPGNSGGALLNMKGELIGINTAILSRGGGSNGVGFAIPSNLVRVFVAAGKGGQPGFQRPYVGGTFAPITSEIAEALGLKVARGALVAKTVSDGPLDAAGVKAGEVITAVNGIAVEHPDALGYRLMTAGVGATVTLTVSNNGTDREVQMALKSAPEATPRDERLIEGRNPFAGALVGNLSPRLAEELHLPNELSGVVVIDINRGSPAARIGLEPRDIIININGVDIDTTETLLTALDDDASFWRIEIERGGQRIRQFIR